MSKTEGDQLSDLGVDNVQSFRSIGFFLRRAAVRAEYMDASLVPEQVVSLSDCIAAAAPSTWAVEWATTSAADRAEGARAFGIPATRLAETIDWITARIGSPGDFMWPDVLRSLPVAREFCRKFVPEDVDVLVLECLVAVDDTSALAEALAPESEAMAEPGLLQMLRAVVAPTEMGTVLGSDIVGSERDGSFHSYLCNGLETIFWNRFAVRPSSKGLYDDHEVARSCAAAAVVEELGEPVPWFAIRLVQHSRTP